MNYLFLAALAAFISFPSIAYEQKTPFDAPILGAVETESAFPEVLERIAVCESQGKHFDAKGNVLKGGYNKYDIGKFQINVLYWGEMAKELEIDVYTEAGNKAMALAIYNKYGTSPWNWSKKCWDK